MSTIQDLARQLGQALADSEEYAAYKKAQAEVEGSLAAQFMLRDFRTRQFEAEKAKLAGTFTPEMGRELQEKAKIVTANPVVREYLMAEARFGNLMMEVQRILGEAVGIDLDRVPGAPGGEGDAGGEAGERQTDHE
ncbi:MAG: YlbF family regulator [Bacillota bacterium]|nr:YlbF family regulator [Bacillota bacterium]